jgi:hypothetical protein
MVTTRYKMGHFASSFALNTGDALCSVDQEHARRLIGILLAEFEQQRVRLKGEGASAVQVVNVQGFMSLGDKGADLGRGLLLFCVQRTFHGFESILCFSNLPLNVVSTGGSDILVGCARNRSRERRATGTVGCWHDLSTHGQATD